MNYIELKNKYQDFMIYEKENHSVKLNISNFRIDKFRGNHDEFVQYIMFVILRIRETNVEKQNLCEMHIDMKNVTNKHFHPFFLKKVLKPLNVVLDGPLLNEDVLGKINIKNVGKYGLILWGIVKPLFHKDTIAKVVMTR